MMDILIIFHFGPKPIKTHQSRSNLDQIKNKIKIISIDPSLKIEIANVMESFVSLTFLLLPSFTTKSLMNSIFFNLPRDQFDFHRVRCKIKTNYNISLSSPIH